jgi:succinyl-diaminopimelate desuccinylase
MENELLALTKRLISVPSEKKNTAAFHEILSIVKQELKDFPYREFESNGLPSLLFSNTDVEQNHFKILLNAHLDVVPGMPNQFVPEIKDGKLFGRGAIDMKSAAAAMILAFRELAKNVTYPLGLQIVMDEEVGGENGTKYQIDQGIRADFVLGGEYSGLKINNEAKGVHYLKLQATGTAAHSAYPWNGKNASVMIAQAIHKIHEILPVPEKEAWISTASVIKIETDNNTVNTIPHNCIAYINIRYIPEEKRDLIQEIKNILPEGVSIETLFDVPPEYTPKDNVFVKKLQTAIEAQMDKLVEYMKTHGQSDLRYYHLIGIPAVNLSPVGMDHHSQNEWVDLKSLDQYYLILKGFLASIL